jgi:hypothetical protein
VNVAYKHLETRLRIAELTLWQWASIGTGLAVALIWALYVSPFGPSVTLFSAVYLGGIPAAAAWLASEAEFDLFLRIRSMWHWRKRRDRYIPGPETDPEGYRLTVPEAEAEPSMNGHFADLDLAALWG